MIITLVRHGETTANESDDLQGQLPGELSEKGVAQSHALAKELKDHQFDFFFSTDLKRGLDTAKAIAQFQDAPLVTDPLLRERNFGIYQGTNRTKFYTHERSLPDPFSHKPEKGESFADLYNRAALFVRKIKKEYSDRSVLVVRDGDIVRMCLGVLQGLTVEESCRLRQSNACINVLHVDEDSQCRLVKFNDVSHLGDELKSNNKSEL